MNNSISNNIAASGRSYGHNNISSNKTVDNPKGNHYGRQSTNSNTSTSTSLHYDATRPHSDSVPFEGGAKYFLNKSYDYSCNSSNASQASITTDQISDHLKYYKEDTAHYYREGGDGFTSKKAPPSFHIGKGILTKEFFSNHRPNVTPSEHDQDHSSHHRSSQLHNSSSLGNSLELNIPSSTAAEAKVPPATARTDLANHSAGGGVHEGGASLLSSASGDPQYRHRNQLQHSQQSRAVPTGRNATSGVVVENAATSTKPKTTVESSMAAAAESAANLSENYSKSLNKVISLSSTRNSRTKVISASKVAVSPAKKKPAPPLITSAESKRSAPSSAEVSPSPPPKQQQQPPQPPPQQQQSPKQQQQQPQPLPLPSINIPVIISEPPTDDDLSPTSRPEQVQNKSSCDEDAAENEMATGASEQQQQQQLEAVKTTREVAESESVKPPLANGILGATALSLSTEKQTQPLSNYTVRPDDSDKSDSDPYVEATGGEDDDEDEDEDEENSNSRFGRVETTGQQPSPRHLLPKVETIALSSSSLSSHSVRLKWSFPGQTDRASDANGDCSGVAAATSEQKKPHFIVDMLRGNVEDSPSSRIVYQGPYLTCRVANLSPQSKYTFRVRSNTDSAVLISNLLTVVTEQLSSGGLRRRTKGQQQQQGQQTQPGGHHQGQHQLNGASAAAGAGNHHHHHHHQQPVLSADGKSAGPSASEVLMRARLSQDQRCAILLLAVFTFTALIIAVLVQHCLGASVN